MESASVLAPRPGLIWKKEKDMADADPVSSNGNRSLQLETLQSIELNKNTVRANRIVGFESQDKRARPFNLMRTQLAKHLAGGVRLLGITSATPAAGKTFLSVNLAASLSKVLEVPTFLLDLDLRRASIAQEVGLEFKAGLSEYLLGERDDLSEIGLRVEGTNLVIFPTHPVSVDTAQAVAGERFGQLMKAMRDQPDGAVVIVDLPPVFANDDAVLSARLLDGYLMVVDSGKTSRRQLADAMEMLSPVSCLGTVLNRYAGGFLDSYGYGSAPYDRYYSDTV